MNCNSVKSFKLLHVAFIYLCIVECFFCTACIIWCIGYVYVCVCVHTAYVLMCAYLYISECGLNWVFVLCWVQASNNSPIHQVPALSCLQGSWDRLNSNQMLWLLPCTVHPCKTSPDPLSSTLKCFPHACYFPFIPCDWITPCSTLQWMKMLGQHRGCTWGGFGVSQNYAREM